MGRHYKQFYDLGRLGQTAENTAPKDGFFEMTVNVSPRGVKLFAMQYVDMVEVISLPELREEITASLKASCEKYEKNYKYRFIHIDSMSVFGIGSIVL